MPNNSESTEKNNGLQLSRRSSLSTSIANIEEHFHNNTDEKPKHVRTENNTFLHKIVKLFDLDLLKDLRFVNLLMGISIAVFAEINFALLTPLILSDQGYNNNSIASFMSTLGIADIIFRFAAPFIGDFLKQTPQVMCIFSFSVAIIGRGLVMIATSLNQLLSIAIGLGVAKGFRSVYLNLVIPAYLPLERLPSASGLQMVSKGIILLMLGPLLGKSFSW